MKKTCLNSSRCGDKSLYKCNRTLQIVSYNLYYNQFVLQSSMHIRLQVVFKKVLSMLLKS